MKANKDQGWEGFYSSLSQMPEWLKKPVPFVVEALPLFKDYSVQTVLDLGCGVGRHSVYLAAKGFDVVGVDASRNALGIAKGWADAEEGLDVKLLRASMTDLPFAGGCFGAVIGVSVVHHAMKAGVERTVDEIYRVLEEGGIFLGNLLSLGDYRCGLGEEVEEGTFRVQEDFEEGQFEELHHFSSKGEASDLLAGFGRVSLEPVQAGKKEQLHCYWKVTAIK